MKTKTQTQKKTPTEATTPAETQAPVAATKPEPRAKTPVLSDALKAEADRIIAKREAKKAPKEKREPEEDLVVFAFRLSSEERELIHRAAGPARASKFVRALAIAAACADKKAVDLLLEQVQTRVA